MISRPPYGLWLQDGRWEGQTSSGESAEPLRVFAMRVRMDNVKQKTLNQLVSICGGGGYEGIIHETQKNQNETCLPIELRRVLLTLINKHEGMDHSLQTLHFYFQWQRSCGSDAPTSFCLASRLWTMAMRAVVISLQAKQAAAMAAACTASALVTVEGNVKKLSRKLKCWVFRLGGGGQNRFEKKRIIYTCIYTKNNRVTPDEEPLIFIIA